MDTKRADDLHLEATYWKEVLTELAKASDTVSDAADLAAKTTVNLATIAMSPRDRQWASIETAMTQTGETMAALLSIQRSLTAILELAGGRADVLDRLVEEVIGNGD